MNILKQTTFLCAFSGILGAWALAPNAEELERLRVWEQNAFTSRGTANAQPAEGIRVIRQSFPIRFNTTSRYGDITLGGKRYAKGIYQHANALLEIRLAKGLKRLVADVGVHDGSATKGGLGSVISRVWVGERKLYESPVLHGGEPARTVDVDLGGAQAVRLETWDAGDGYNCDQAVWANLTLTCLDGSVVDPATLPFDASAAKTSVRTSHWPFSFVYGGVSSDVFLDSWTREETAAGLRFRDPAGQLEVDCVRDVHPGWPVSEWVLRFRNVSKTNTKILERVRPFDLALPARAPQYTLHRANGSPCRATDYLPEETILKAAPDWFESTFRHIARETRVATSGGCGSASAWPYFNLEAQGEGMIAAIGWSGQWAADFAVSSEDNLLRMTAGQEDGRFYLKPGEEVRSPRAVVLFWKRDHWFEAQNVWRAWLIARRLHRPGGTLVTHLVNAASSYYFGCNTPTPMNAANQIATVNRFLEHGIPLDHWWIDAAWYPCGRNSWYDTGAWRPDPVRFPRGLREVTDHLRAKGLRSIVWFEPERCVDGSELERQHPDFLYPGKGSQRLVNLGNPEAWNWVVSHIEGLVAHEGIDVYRQDFNMSPLDTWRRNDAREKDRVGLSEMKHVDGYYRWYAEILRRDPKRQIDSCAGGGRRNDVETMYMAVPFLRSDFTQLAESQQSQTMGLGLWVPFYGASMFKVDRYSFRSWSTPYLHITGDVTAPDFDWDSLRGEIALWKKHLVPYFDKDFYPLTPFGVARDTWAGWQFHDPATGRGVLQLFRRDRAPYPVLTVRPFGLEKKRVYTFTDVDTGRVITARGGESFEFRIAKPGSAVLVSYFSH